MSLDEIRNERIKKLALLKNTGMDPYPIYARRNMTVAKALERFNVLSKSGKDAALSGRIISIREQGGLIFFHFTDGTGTLQGALRREEINEKLFRLFIDAVDIGDFITARGSLGLTKRGEKTLFAYEWQMIAKSIRPLPEKYHGLQDAEERFRRRYLDLVSNEGVRERFALRTNILTTIRAFLDKAGYVEVETPILQPQYGGASAEPFKTHHNALDIDLYLRISDELYLKRLLIGGFPKVYEMSKNFRNEGVDATHYPEFTMLEFYEAYSDAKKQMAFVEKLIKALVKKECGGVVQHDGAEIDFSKKFAREKYADVFAKHSGVIGAFTLKKNELETKAREAGVTVEEGDSEAKILDNIFKKMCRPKIIQPTFVTDFPAEYLPLAKKKDKKTVDAFQFYAGGIELVKAFSELNNPLEQRERFLAQEKFRAAGDEEAQQLDEDYVEAMEYGMPPAGGVGIGIDRLVMFLTGTKNIKETILFPTMRPRKEI